MAEPNRDDVFPANPISAGLEARTLGLSGARCDD